MDTHSALYGGEFQEAHARTDHALLAELEHEGDIEKEGREAMIYMLFGM